MAARCTGCGRQLGTTAELGLDDVARLQLRAELVRAIGPMAVRGRLDGPLDLVGYTLNGLGVPCPGCGASAWSDAVDPPG